MTTNLVSIYKKVGKEIMRLSVTKRDTQTLNALIEEFDYFAAIPGIRDTEHHWISVVEGSYKKQSTRRLVN